MYWWQIILHISYFFFSVHSKMANALMHYECTHWTGRVGYSIEGMCVCFSSLFFFFFGRVHCMKREYFVGIIALSHVSRASSNATEHASFSWTYWMIFHPWIIMAYMDMDGWIMYTNLLYERSQFVKQYTDKMQKCVCSQKYAKNKFKNQSANKKTYFHLSINIINYHSKWKVLWNYSIFINHFDNKVFIFHINTSKYRKKERHNLDLHDCVQIQVFFFKHG